MQNVREEQLLVLLLVMTAQFHELRDSRGSILLQQPLLAIVNMLTIAKERLERRPSQQASAWARMACADGLIVGVEQEIKILVKYPVPRQMRYEHEALEEPRRMSQMPFRRAGVRHGLHRGICIRQRCDQRLT